MSASPIISAAPGEHTLSDGATESVTLTPGTWTEIPRQLVCHDAGGKRKAGRVPAKDSKGHAVKMALAEWRLTPPHLREPKTLGALADKLDVHRNTLAYYDRQTPKSPEEFIDAIDRGALGRYYPEAVEAIGRKAAQGNVEAFKAFARTIVEPRRPDPQRSSSMGLDPHLQDAIQRLVSPKADLTITAQQTTVQIETKPPESEDCRPG